MKQIRMQSGRSLGFSLIEIAVVLVILAILVTAVGIPLAAQLDQQRTIETQKQLESIKEAIFGFAMANGRLPCPAALAGTSGVEDGTPSTGVCNTYSGFVPAATLGLSPLDSSGLLVDGWGLTQNRIRYAVRDIDIVAATVTAVPACALSAKALTRTDGIKTATMSCLANANAAVNLLTVTSTTITNAGAGCTPANLSLKAPFVIFSLGKNAAAGGTGPDEAQNVLAAATTFVSHTPTPAGHCAGEFDDIVTWGSLNTLFARMVQAGRLP